MGFVPSTSKTRARCYEPLWRNVVQPSHYEFTKVYKNTFDLRHALYLSAYALFCAATVLPWQEAQRNIILFFWRALQEFQSGANLSLNKPLLIIRNLMGRADIDVVALVTASKIRGASPRERHETCPTEEVRLSILMTCLRDSLWKQGICWRRCSMRRLSGRKTQLCR